MRIRSRYTAAGVIVGAALMVCLMAATMGHRRPIDLTGPMPGGPVQAPPPAMLVSQTQLDPAVHPAADPRLGELWAVSRRLIMPVEGVSPDDLVDTFTQSRGPNRRHEAIDITAPRGTPVLAVTDGEILRLTEHDSGGITLYQLAPDGQTMFYYAHLLKYANGVRAGVAVRQGDVIGYVGDTGNAGPGNYHLHFEVMTAPDPRQYHAARPRNPYPLLLRSRG
jgi:peptidoglycan LD-endopeptidase LytH